MEKKCSLSVPSNFHHLSLSPNSMWYCTLFNRECEFGGSGLEHLWKSLCILLKDAHVKFTDNIGPVCWPLSKLYHVTHTITLALNVFMFQMRCKRLKESKQIGGMATNHVLNRNDEECKTILPPNFTSPSLPNTENMNNVLWLLYL